MMKFRLDFQKDQALAIAEIDLKQKRKDLATPKFNKEINFRDGGEDSMESFRRVEEID